jgi:Na+-translocating ferredoxin:NAD+ oxidoreductase RnfC subunit
MKQHFCPAEQSMIAFEKECNWCGEQEGSMTQDEIIEMAKEAGIVVTGEAIYTLCKLATAKEREACAKVADGFIGGDVIAERIRARGQA